MKRKGSFLVVLAMILALLPAGPAQAAGALEAETSYTLVSPPVFEDDRYLLSWHGEISGDVNGYIQWWIDTWNWTAWPDILDPELPPKPESHYLELVRIYDEEGGTLLLEALNRGKTSMTTMTWWANGTVTYADPDLFPGLTGQGVLESGVFDFATTPPSGTSTFSVTMKPIVSGMVLVDSRTNEDVGPLTDGTVIDLGTTPQFNIRVDTVPGTVGSVGFAVVDSNTQPVRFRLDGQPRENFPPYAVGGDWPVGNYLPMTIGRGTYTVTATPYSGGSLRGEAGPSYSVTFTVAEPFKADLTGEVRFEFGSPAHLARCGEEPAGPLVLTDSSGTATTMGAVTATWAQCAIGATGGFIHQAATMVAANGDQLLLAADNAAGEIPYMATVVGGTGKFESATGSAQVTFAVVPQFLPPEVCEPSAADPCFDIMTPWPWSGTVEGTIAY